ncbi:MAG: polyphosphate polymerase domain-containing protein [Clostridia bacterium]|nr:polyphosphate polymerase domain-containing protein [Clostridia bacterium]
MSKLKYVFNRYEIKYLLTPEQYETMLKGIEGKAYIDEYGETTIQSLYYDTPDKLLIRRSIEKPEYKEKIRVRSYGLATSESKVFLELKKKSEKIVFKRRIALRESEVEHFFNTGEFSSEGQIEEELKYFRSFYKTLAPSMLLLYDRSAYHSPSEDIRITFDRNIRYRTDRLDLKAGLDGELICDGGEVMMEIKTGTAYPMWLVRLLNDNKIYKRSFSKYGNAYRREFEKQRQANQDKTKESTSKCSIRY